MKNKRFAFNFRLRPVKLQNV